MLTIADCIYALSGKRIPAGNIPITQTVIDSRRVIPGSMFIALKGEKTDGSAYISEAFAKGAILAITQEKSQTGFPILDLNKLNIEKSCDIPATPFCILVEDSLNALQDLGIYRRNQLKCMVIGITGSVGKSSTKELTAEVLGYRYRTHKNPGNYNNEIGLPLTLLNAGSGIEALVLEMGFYVKGEIEMLCQMAKPQIGVITNIGTVHAERSGTREAIAAGKAELVESLPEEPLGTAILNYDDLLVRDMSKKTKAGVLFYGTNSDADIWADNIIGKGLKGVRFDLHHMGEKHTLDVPMIGRHSVNTALRACCAAFVAGMNWSEISHALESSSNQLRMVAVQTYQGALLIDDTYNATPESTIAALDLMRDLKGRKIAVLGDMLELGQYAQSGHTEVGQHAAQVADQLLAVGKLGKIIAESAIENGLPATKVMWAEDTSGAIEILKTDLNKGDVVLVKGSHGLRMDRIATALEESQ